jgi:hypothetical protein
VLNTPNPSLSDAEEGRVSVRDVEEGHVGFSDTWEGTGNVSNPRDGSGAVSDPSFSDAEERRNGLSDAEGVRNQPGSDSQDNAEGACVSESEYDETSHLLPEVKFRDGRRIYNRNARASYFETFSAHPLRAPPRQKDARTGVLFLCRTESGLVQKWVWEDGRWIKVEDGHRHPVLSGYYLIMKTGEPHWVQMATLKRNLRKSL